MKIELKTTINAPVYKVWSCFTLPEHIINWNFASEGWYCPKAENDLKPGGKFNYRMEARDDDIGFDLMGIYDTIISLKRISYHLEDNRNVEILFEEFEGYTTVTEIFDTEEQNPIEIQSQGWQAILDNFRRYTENNEQFKNLSHES